MTDLQNLADLATKDILEKNLQIYHKDIFGKKIILIYDVDSTLSMLISSGYIKNIKNYPNYELIEYKIENSNQIKDKILSLDEKSCVIMVQSTNFRLEEFRIRISLQQRNIAGIEHNHLSYIKENQTLTYLNSISYNGDFFEEISNKLKYKIEKGNILKINSLNNTYLIIEGGFEDMKQNTGNFPINNRYGTYPVGENFTESKDFLKVNGELYIKAYPGENFEVIFCEPFRIKIEKSIIVDLENPPENFLKIFNKIKLFEGEVMIRELGFGLNNSISFNTPLNDINAFERMMGFHLSIGKKHNIYRKKLSQTIPQRYHIDIFPKIEEISIDDEIIFKNNSYI